MSANNQVPTPFDNPHDQPVERHEIQIQVKDPPHEEGKSRWDRIADKLDDLLSGPRWARLMAGMLVITVALFGYLPQLRDAIRRWNEPAHSDPYQGQGVHDPQKDDPSSIKATSAQTEDQKHLNLHLTRGDGKVIGGPELVGLSPSGDELQITYFSSDHCVRVHRHHGEAMQDKWVAEIGSEGAVASKYSSTLEPLPTVHYDRDALERDDILPVKYSVAHLKRVEGRCINPHPGQFRWWWGPANGCLVPMYRQFQDGCTHYQIFNSCANFWDANINWTACVH